MANVSIHPSIDKGIGPAAAERHISQQYVVHADKSHSREQIKDLQNVKYRTVSDKADYEHPHQYAIGVQHVFVNGKQVLKNGEHTGALPGRCVRGQGWKK